ncbi:MAG: energy-coupling factor transporter transmembrane protein EcfT, partial [Candidatus Thorarchaeota archaeon]|nr:energy-coupling factor transporter transmembrane protein EcfT [Candidatus Thorarchaeota archaeon]
LTYRLGDQTVILHFFDWPIPGTAVNYGDLTVGGVMFGLLVSTRIIAVVTVLPIFTMTTSMSRLNAALAKVKVPKKIIFMLVTAMRFVPLVQESWQAIIDAQKIRAFDIEKANFFQKIRRAYVPIVTPLLLLMFRKAMDLEVAINARAFGAQKERTYIEDISFKRVDYAGFLAVFAVFISMVYLLLYQSQPIALFMYQWLVIGWTAFVSILQMLGILALLQVFNTFLIGIPYVGLYFGFFDQNLLLGYGGVFALLILVFVVYKLVQRRMSD